MSIISGSTVYTSEWVITCTDSFSVLSYSSPPASIAAHDGSVGTGEGDELEVVLQLAGQEDGEVGGGQDSSHTLVSQRHAAQQTLVGLHHHQVVAVVHQTLQSLSHEVDRLGGNGRRGG